MPNNTPSSSPSSADYDRPSKSQIKREMRALQDLGKELVDQSPDRLKQLSLSEVLFDAIRDAQRNTSREGRRRQIHYVGKLLRSADAAIIRQKLDEWTLGSQESTRAMHRLESLRDTLIEDDNALTGFLDEYPDTDVQHLRTLIRTARKETQHNTTLKPGDTPGRKHYRALYQALKQIDDTRD